jgi:hypothetical protein
MVAVTMSGGNAQSPGWLRSDRHAVNSLAAFR